MIINSTHYCWVIGNTGFRENALYEKIESYLIILEKFKAKGYNWSVNQREFFELMNEFGFMEKASTSDVNAPKAARLKTSPLEKLGLITGDRAVTAVGNEILLRSKERMRNKNLCFDEDYFLQNDGDIYLKQLLKLQFFANSSEAIKPFVLFLSFLNEFTYLSAQETAYILPLIISRNLIDYGRASIIKYRRDKKSPEFNSDTWFKKYLISHKDNLSSIIEIKKYISSNIDTIELNFRNNDENEIKEFIIKIDDNGKSKDYSLKLYDLFVSSYAMWSHINDFESCKQIIANIVSAIDKTSSTQSKEWRKAILGVTNKSVFKSMTDVKYKDYIDYFKSNIYASDFQDFMLNMFDNLWYIKLLNNLNDYADHNTRYMKLSNILESICINGENALKISDFYTVLCQKILLDTNIHTLITNVDKYQNYLYNNTYSLPLLLEDDMKDMASNIIAQINSVSPKKVNSSKPVDINYRQWISMLNDRFIEEKILNMIEQSRQDIINNNSGNIINCLSHIETRNDSKLRQIIETESDIPTIFEYLVWKSFLILGNYASNPVKFANFSFDNDLKPVQHAGGSMADVIFKYDSHDLILEATLTNDENQRKLEMEPVPRHLARYIHDVRKESYCIFVAPNIDPNVAVVYKAFREYPYYVKNKTFGNYEAVNGLHILPLSVKDLKSIIKYSIKNDALYNEIKSNVFEPLLCSNTNDGYLWYTNEIAETIQHM